MQITHIKHQVKIAVALLFGIIFVGVVGYEIIEGWDWFDSLYMTIITITTTGYREVRPLSPAGRFFTMFILVLGVATIAYTGGRIAQLFVETYLQRRKKMSRKVQSLKNHYIVCGYGRMGKKICEVLKKNKADFVVIERNPEEIERLREHGLTYVEGDATEDEILNLAGIKQAKGLVAALPTEADNVFATLSARVLNPNIFIVARAVEEETESKLIKAGANRVVKPYEIGGNRMAQVLLRPGLVDFIEIIARDRPLDLNVEEITVTKNSKLVNTTLAQSPIRKELNIIIIAIFRKNGEVIYNPQSNTIIKEGDRLIVIGEEKNIKELSRLALSTETH